MKLVFSDPSKKFLGNLNQMLWYFDVYCRSELAMPEGTHFLVDLISNIDCRQNACVYNENGAL